MKQALSILLGYLTCDDDAVRTKWANLLASYWHKDEGKIVTSITTAANGDVTIVVKDGDGNSKTTTIAKTQLPTSYEISFINGLQDALNNKVDKVPGKGLSTNDFTTALKQKLIGLSNYVHPDTHSISEVEGLPEALDAIPTQTSDLENDAGFITENELPDVPEQDGRTYHRERANDTEDVAPTTEEVAEPKAGDTAIVTLSNGVVELYSFSTAWAKDSTPVDDRRLSSYRESTTSSGWKTMTFEPLDGIHKISGSGSNQYPTIKFPTTIGAGDVVMEVFLSYNSFVSKTIIRFSIGSGGWGSFNALSSSKIEIPIYYDVVDGRRQISFKTQYVKVVGVTRVSVSNNPLPNVSDWVRGWEWTMTSATGTEVTDLLPKGKISVKDHLNSEQWSSNILRLNEYFVFNEVEKMVGLDPTAITDADIRLTKKVFNQPTLMQNNIDGVVDNSDTRTSILSSTNLFTSSNGLSNYTHVFEAYNREKATGTILPTKATLRVYLYAANGLFSNSFNTGGITSQEILLYTYETVNASRGVGDKLHQQLVTLVTTVQNSDIAQAQWSSISFNEILDTGTLTQTSKSYYIRDAADSRAFGAEELQVRIKTILTVEYADPTNVNEQNKEYLARVNNYGAFIEKIK